MPKTTEDYINRLNKILVEMNYNRELLTEEIEKFRTLMDKAKEDGDGLDYYQSYKKAGELFHFIDVNLDMSMFNDPKYEVEKWKYAKSVVRDILDAAEVKND